MGCCEVKEGAISNSELFLNTDSEDSFNDLSIFSHKCESKALQPQMTDFRTLKEQSMSNLYKASLETAFTLVSPQRLQEKDLILTPENSDQTTLTGYQSETLGRVI